ncbi:MAG: EAL domain-containing protein [Austwickia sp.]|nr:EAL domain-containing protein [Austwickia sp.]
MGAFSLVVILAIIALYIADPNGVGETAFATAALGCVVATVIGPVSRRRAVALWAPAAGGGALFVLSFVARSSTEDSVAGPLGWADLFSFSAYLSLAAFLLVVLRKSGSRATLVALIDTFVIGCGAALALWTIAVVPLFAQVGGMEQSLVSATYPLLDVLLLTLSAQLVFRVRIQSFSIWALFGALLILQVVDTAYTFVWQSSPGASVPQLSALYLLVFWLFAVAMCHRSLGAVEAAQPNAMGDVRSSRGAVLLLSAVSPVILSIVSHTRSVADGLTRSALVAAIFILLFIRLSSTIARLEKAEEGSRFRALHDPLTGLPNRASFFRELQATGVDVAAGRKCVCLLYLDFDHFKLINDTYGHVAGDVVLSTVAHRLRSIARREDFVGRLGGDEFVWIAPIDSTEEAPALAERAVHAFQTELTLPNGEIVQTPVSVGLTVRDRGSLGSLEQALLEADIALRHAKNQGRGQSAIFHGSLQADHERRHIIQMQLEAAVRTEQITIALQPIMGGNAYGQVVGWEALARWQHPELGLVLPDSFVPYAEQTGLIEPLTKRIFELACAELVARRRAYHNPELFVSVNVSPVQLNDTRLASALAVSLAASGLDEHSVWVEITESTLIRLDQALSQLAALREMGLRICIDDFGAGHSALSRLQAVSADYVKMDRSLVTGVATEKRAEQVVDGVLRLMQAVGVRGVVAEGVETREQAAVLDRLGCQMAQGWLFGSASLSERN